MPCGVAQAGDQGRPEHPLSSIPTISAGSAEIMTGRCGESGGEI